MTIINHYIEGATVTLEARFSFDGTLTDPTTISLIVKLPDTTSYTLTYADQEIDKLSAGIYSVDIILNQVGAWNYRWEGHGAVEAVGERTINVKASKVI